MLRGIRNKILLCACILGAALLLKYRFPAAGQEVGRWLSGAGSRVSSAISCFAERLRTGGLADAVEVFHEAFENHEVP